ncbi:MAG: nucleotidyltransferase substrate binding protein [Ignavibacteriaceae bacterium]|nr:nucleotidyltransferase substrate binding protein [Ignavibacteriaceae bacterium]
MKMPSIHPDKNLKRLDFFLTKLQSIDFYTKGLSGLEIAGMIKWFELSFELARKVMQDYLAATGYKDIKGPRPVIMQMGRDNIIDPFRWEELLNARNELTHLYDEELSLWHHDKILSEYLPLLTEFRDIIRVKYDNL